MELGSSAYQMRLHRMLESDLYADHHHPEEGRRRRRRRKRESLPCQEDTLELSSEEPPPEPSSGESNRPVLSLTLPNLALAGDPATQVASYWLKVLDAESEPPV